MRAFQAPFENLNSQVPAQLSRDWAPVDDGFFEWVPVPVTTQKVNLLYLASHLPFGRKTSTTRTMMTFSCCCCYCKPSNLETKSLDNTFRSRTRPGSINPGADDDKRDTHTSEVSSSKNLIYHQIKHQITLLTNCYACHNSHVSSQLQCCVYCLALLLLLLVNSRGKSVWSELWAQTKWNAYLDFMSGMMRKRAVPELQPSLSL